MDHFGWGNRFIESFTENMSGGAFVCRVGKGHELLYANQNMVRLFECDTYEEFAEYVRNSFDGMVSSAQLKAILKEVDLQILERKKISGHLFYHITTKNGNIHLVEEHWTRVQDPMEGDIFYSFVVSREFESSGSDYDLVTGLYGKKRFQNYVSMINQDICGYTEEKYAVAYLNFVNFKLLNITKGIAEGDACLKTIADLLSDVFEDAFLARLSDDHFAVFAKAGELIRKIEVFLKRFHDEYGLQYDVIAKCGIFSFYPDAHFDVEAGLSFAKVACDSIKYNPKLDWIEYSAELARQRRTSEYVVRKLDDALKNGWIKVYYQPVIRALTQQLCGMESLVRWQDPELGMISPKEFIGTLEESRQIHKLDCYVVDMVCRTLHDRIDNKLPVVPVSVNFSRMDFVMCDMLKAVEDAVAEYDIPRDYIHIEITESMIASDEELMRGVIDKFRQAGYEIWMDDFGSGYSSLTLLKDYQFDMLKLDMNFLSKFTQRSQKIMQTTISMAKDLGMKTLAEGVETEEQLKFLREIGCGEIQGYYYGKPQPLEELFRQLEEKHITVETRKWRHFYEVASTNVRATDTPLEVIEDDGTNFKTLFMNQPYKDQFLKEDLELEEIDRLIYHTASPLLAKYREYANHLRETKDVETFYYTDHGNYLCLKAQSLVQRGTHQIIKASLFNITENQWTTEIKRLDSLLRDLALLFERVMLIDLSNDTLTTIMGKNVRKGGKTEWEEKVAKEELAAFESAIYPSQKIAYREFVRLDNLKGRIELAGRGYVTDEFLMRQEDGSYQWRENILMMISGTGGSQYLYCMKPFVDYRSRRDGDARESACDEQDETLDISPETLWRNLVENSSIKFFWKDRRRRFFGASQAFLDFYGLDSDKELIGKKDEEMPWQLIEEDYRNKEYETLQKGISSHDVPGQCILKGTVHNILSSAIPIYENGEIVGLMGHFTDCSEKAEEIRRERGTMRDPVTNLISARAFVDAMMDFTIQYHENGRNYGVIVLQNSKHSRVTETYGEEFAKYLFKIMAEKIVEITGPNCVVSRTKGAYFAVLTYIDDEQNFIRLAEKLGDALNGMNKVDGNPLTIRMKIAAKMRTEPGITDENIYERALEELDRQEPAKEQSNA